jgi:hypothetical protein
MKVFMVSAGDYSDYSVKALFTRRELAEGYMDARPGGYFNEVEEWELHDKPITQVVIYSGKWWGKMAEPDFWDYIIDDNGGHETTFVSRNGKGIQATSTDREKVVKIVSDYRAKILAEEAGVA